MLRNYFKTAWRSILNHKTYSFINISGLAVGMAVTIMIGIWVYDELSFEKGNAHYNNIVQVVENSNIGDGISTGGSLPLPLSATLREQFKNDFDKVAATITYPQDIAYGNNAFSKLGCYTEPAFADIITLQLLKGTSASLNDRSSILLSASFAKAMFGESDPIGKTVKVNNSSMQKVTGVYLNLPQNTRFSNIDFIAPINLVFGDHADDVNWFSSAFQVYALLNNNANARQLSTKIKNTLYEHTKDATKPALFLYPMDQWHLYEFKNGQLVAGRMQFVWLFAIIGSFVLLLACINFMNLSTAQSEKRAKEVGIRKTVGAVRRQLVFQFFSESFLTVILSFVLSLIIVHLALPFFNEVAGKQMHLPWSNGYFWVMSIGFICLTALIAGSYPAFYLSSFKPFKVLKGAFKTGRFAAIPRQTLVVLQFTVSIILVIGTIIVFEQVQFAKNRPVGYNRNNLITIPYNASTFPHYQAFRNEILQTGAVKEMSASSSPTTGIWSSADNLNWKGKDPNRQEMFGTILIDPDYGNVVDWKIKEGRNFSKQFATDSAAFIFNEAAIKQMNLLHPVGENVQWHGRNWTIVGVVKDMVMRSPFDPATPTVFLMDDKERSFNVIHLKINPAISATKALNKIETVFKKFAPTTPFTYKFMDEEYALKFAEEERIGKLSTLFASLAIFISCLGLFGMASFVTAQRTKEIGVRKVLGASVVNLWSMLSKDFVVLVILSCIIAIPIAYYCCYHWLQHYEYRTPLSWWIFVAAGVGALLLTLFTVSFRSVKAAMANPVKSLRTE